MAFRNARPAIKNVEICISEEEMCDRYRCTRIDRCWKMNEDLELATSKQERRCYL